MSYPRPFTLRFVSLYAISDRANYADSCPQEPPPDAFQKTGPRSPISNSFTSGSNQPPATSLSRSHSLQHNHASNFFSTSTSHRHGDRLTPSDSPAHSPGPDTIANGPETLADHAAFSTRHGSSHSFSHTFDTGSNPPLTPGGLLGQSPNTPHGSSPSVSKTHPLGSFGTDTLKSSTSSQTETHDVSLQHSHPQASSSTISQPEKASGSGSGGSSSNPYRSFRVTLEDPCYKVLPAALKKYKINDDWRDYALFICYGNGTTERCLSLDEKPLLLFQKLKDSGQNPVFMLRHIKDIKSPIHVASQKHASRREKRAKDKEATLTNSSTLNNVLTSTTSRTAKVYGDGSTGNEDGEGAEKSETPVSASSQSQPLPNPVTAPIKGYCISIYPYMAEREVSKTTSVTLSHETDRMHSQDEFDVAVGDTFVIVTKAKGWWVVFRQSALSAQTVDSDPKTTSSGWVPAGCLLETTLTPTVLAADPTASSVNASRVPIKPVNIVSVSTPGLALMDFKPMGSDELHLIKNEYVRVYKRYNQ